MLLGRLRRAGLADEDCVPLPDNSPQVLEIVVESRRRRRGRRARQRCHPDSSCVCCSAGLLLLIGFALCARFIIGESIGFPSRPGADANLTENVTGGASGQSVHGAVSLDATGNQSDTTDAVGASHHGNNSDDDSGWSTQTTSFVPFWSNTSDGNTTTITTTADGSLGSWASASTSTTASSTTNTTPASATESTTTRASSTETSTLSTNSSSSSSSSTTESSFRTATVTSTGSRTSTTNATTTSSGTGTSTITTSHSKSSTTTRSDTITTSSSGSTTSKSSRTTSPSSTSTTSKSTASHTETSSTTSESATRNTDTSSTTSQSTTSDTDTSRTTSQSTTSNTKTNSTASQSATSTTSQSTTSDTDTSRTTSQSTTSTTNTNSTTSQSATSTTSQSATSNTDTSSTTTESFTNTNSESITSSTDTTSTTSESATSNTETRSSNNTVTSSSTFPTTATWTENTMYFSTISTTRSFVSSGFSASTTEAFSSPASTTWAWNVSREAGNNTQEPPSVSMDFEYRPSGALEAMPNCYLVPLVEKPGCQLLRVQEGLQFGLNELGQETTARRNCLESARSLGNSWVFRLHRCEAWHCSSKTALQRAADSGPPSGTFLLDHKGRLLSTTGGKLVAEEVPVFSWALAFDARKMMLRSADGLWVTASSQSLEATAAGGGDVFNVTFQGGGEVTLRMGNRLLHSGEAVGLVEAADLPGTRFTLVSEEHLRDAWRNQTVTGDALPGRAWVHSSLCSYQEPLGGEGGRERRRATFVKLWEWPYVDVLKECQEVLGPAHVDAVQLSPVTEHIRGSQWWVRYQPVSASLHSRSGTPEELRAAVAGCRQAGVEVVVDVVLNHMARPCPEAQHKAHGMPCVGWNGTSYGNRRTAGARNWDAASPLHFHHGQRDTWGACGVGPDTGFLCGSPVTTDCSCCPCDMYGLPDWDLKVAAVQEANARHLEELHRMGVTMLRIDAALYMESELVSRFLNRFPWDVVYQEWWNEMPFMGRTDVFGLYRDLKFMRRVAERLQGDVSKTHEVLDVTRGNFYISPAEAVYPTCFHDGRSEVADPAVPTFKNGLAFHQQQLFMLASPYPSTVVLWGGYGWRSIDDGPPGCEEGQELCAASTPSCLETPKESPLPSEQAQSRQWICEHRWEGVAGLILFRQRCAGAIADRWVHGDGHVAFRLGNSCFVALTRGSDWPLRGLRTALPEGNYCDLASWDLARRLCHRRVLLGKGGLILEGGVAAGGLLAISASVMEP